MFMKNRSRSQRATHRPGAVMEKVESRVLFSTAVVVPPPPPPPPAVTLVKGQLSIFADPKKVNVIDVTLSKDGKNIDVLFDGKASAYPVKSVNDVTVHDNSKGDTVLVNLAGLAPKKPPVGAPPTTTPTPPPPPPPPPPPTGVSLKNGVLTVAGNQTTNNAIALARARMANPSSLRSMANQAPSRPPPSPISPSSTGPGTTRLPFTLAR